jgi:PAS domain S-box-containing protein
VQASARTLIVVATALASLAATAAAWVYAREQAGHEERVRFELRVEEIATALRGRMLDYEQVLRGAVALFAASESVERDEWAAYVRLLETANSYPGIQAIGYGRLERARDGARIPVTFIEPADERNLQVLGVDMYADAARRSAMDRARDAAEPVLSGPLQLLQDRGGAPRTGLVIVLPVYRTGAPPASLQSRRAALTGFVYGAFRVRELVERTVGTPPGIRLRLLDVSDPGAPAPLFEQEAAFSGAGHERAEVIVVRGRTWRLEATAPGLAEVASDRPRLVLAGGLAISLLLTILTWSLLNTVAHARGLARRMVAAGEELERFRAAVDGHQDTMIMVDAKAMRMVYVSEGACRNLGYRREELVGRSPAVIFADRDGGALEAEYRSLAASAEPSEVYRALHRRKDGSTYPVEISREAVKSGGETYILGIARDITARLKAEAALRESERRLGLALESSGLALFDWDVASGLVHLGAEWSAILGAAPKATVTPIQKLQALVHPDDLPALLEQVRQLLKGEIASYRVEHRVRAARGEWLWIESVAEVSERDAAGQALRVTGTNGDVTARRALGELKNAFLANVSHELRTPLTGIVASLELLKEGAAGELPAQASRFVEMAHANSERLSELIGDLLDLERVESGRLKLELERIDAGALLAEAAELNAPYASRFSARLSLRAEPGLQVTADRKRLLQVLTNLISNAAKFSPPGGEIALAAAGQGNRVVLSVSDQGPGVPEAFRARLFGKFEQADHGKAGTGLGLAICKSLVERMGGRIWCESEPGRGATFLAELPRAA